MTTQLPGELDMGLAAEVVRFQAWRLQRLGVCSWEDAHQELLAEAWRRWPEYSPQRGSPTTFLQMVMRQRASALRRQSRAQKRGGGWCNLGEVVLETIEAVENRAAYNSDVQRRDLRLDLEQLLAALPPDHQRICRGLNHDTIAEVARKLQIPRHRLLCLLKTIRSHFQAADLQEYLP
ncbi:MAG: hypothetical protein HJJLKODD_02677 [Phycisphaerae bacterium]|nr:hypothetical protein [Phycisphaerae bacterium]